MGESPCPLCGCPDSVFYHRDTSRAYRQCPECSLVFVEPAYYLTVEQEKACYDLHQNSPDDPAYRRFLGRLCEPLCERVTAPAAGLDFGSGPGPTLSLMFVERGYDMAIYDPFFADDRSVLDRQYDFISCTEVVEHLHRPGEVLTQLLAMLKPGGWLGLMTKLVRDVQSFATWHYKLDPTHVVFFSHATFSGWAQRQNVMVEFIGEDVILIHKSR